MNHQRQTNKSLICLATDSCDLTGHGSHGFGKAFIPNVHDESAQQSKMRTFKYKSLKMDILARARKSCSGHVVVYLLFRSLIHSWSNL